MEKKWLLTYFLLLTACNHIAFSFLSCTIGFSILFFFLVPFFGEKFVTRGCPYKCTSFILLESSDELCVPSSFLGHSYIAARMPGFSAPWVHYF